MRRSTSLKALQGDVFAPQATHARLRGTPPATAPGMPLHRHPGQFGCHHPPRPVGRAALRHCAAIGDVVYRVAAAGPVACRDLGSGQVGVGSSGGRAAQRLVCPSGLWATRLVVFGVLVSLGWGCVGGAEHEGRPAERDGGGDAQALSAETGPLAPDAGGTPEASALDSALPAEDAPQAADDTGVGIEGDASERWPDLRPALDQAASLPDAAVDAPSPAADSGSPAAALDAVFVSQQVPTTMVAGDSYAVSITLRNSGTTTWTAGHRLGSQLPADNWRWGPQRMRLPAGATVKPGASHTFTWTVFAPANAGDYRFAWRMVEGTATWFGVQTPLVSVTVTPRPPASKTKYVLLNGGFNEFSKVADAIQSALPSNATARSVRAGVALIFYTHGGNLPSVKERLRQVLDEATQRNLPIFIQVDVENWVHQDLVNWYDESAAGFNPDNIRNVERYDWAAGAGLKIAWRNWGRQIRIKPPYNLMSSAVRRRMHEVYDLLLPVVVDWQRALPASQKDLFVGWKVGWESGIGLNAQYHPDGNSYYERWPDDPSNDPTTRVDQSQPPHYGMQQIGYAAVQSAKLKSSGAITETDLATVIGRHLTDLSRRARERGIPVDKIYTHSRPWTSPITPRGTNARAAVNPHSCPGWSDYKVNTGGLRSADPDIDQAITAATRRNVCKHWGVVEFNVGTRAYGWWHTYLQTVLIEDPTCKLVTIYNYDTVTSHEGVRQAIAAWLR